MEPLRMIVTSTMLIGGGAITLAQMPGVPDGFQDWRATAIIGFLLFCALLLIGYMVRNMFAVLTRLAERLGGISEQLGTTNSRLEELGAKIGKHRD